MARKGNQTGTTGCYRLHVTGRILVIGCILVVLTSTAGAWALGTHTSLTINGEQLVTEQRQTYDGVDYYVSSQIRGSRAEDDALRYVNHFEPAWEGYSGTKRTLADLYMGLPPKPYQTGYDWIEDDGKGRNWGSAIRAYGYTLPSRQRAYLRLGHVLHIVQDYTNEDHVTGTPHPGSSKWEKGEEFNNVVLAANAASYATLTAAGLTTDIKEAHPQAEGFEEFAEQRDINREGDSIVNERSLRSILDSAKQESMDEADEAGVEPPLGLEDTTALDLHLRPTIVPTWVEDADWFDEENDPDETEPDYFHSHIEKPQPYREYAEAATKTASEHVAAAQVLFHDIVNQPPFVKTVNVYRDKKDSSQYYSEWINSPGGIESIVSPNGTQVGSISTVTGRTQYTIADDPLVCDQTYTVKIVFGPQQAPPVENIDADSVMVKVGPKKLTGSLDGNVWTGTIVVPPKYPEETLEDWRQKVRAKFGNGQVTIAGEDKHNHYPREGLPEQGYKLDINPGTPAHVQPTDGYPWEGYGAWEAGRDKNHGLTFSCDETPTIDENDTYNFTPLNETDDLDLNGTGENTTLISTRPTEPPEIEIVDLIVDVPPNPESLPVSVDATAEITGMPDETGTMDVSFDAGVRFGENDASGLDYEWDFANGDDEVMEASHSFQYEEPGPYDVTVTAELGGTTVTESTTIDIPPVKETGALIGHRLTAATEISGFVTQQTVAQQSYSNQVSKGDKDTITDRVEELTEDSTSSGSRAVDKIVEEQTDKIKDEMLDESLDEAAEEVGGDTVKQAVEGSSIGERVSVTEDGGVEIADSEPETDEGTEEGEETDTDDEGESDDDEDTDTDGCVDENNDGDCEGMEEAEDDDDYEGRYDDDDDYEGRYDDDDDYEGRYGDGEGGYGDDGGYNDDGGCVDENNDGDCY